MTEKRNIFSENNLVSATECTGAAPRAMDEEAAETIADITNNRCSPSFTATSASSSSLTRLREALPREAEDLLREARPGKVCRPLHLRG